MLSIKLDMINKMSLSQNIKVPFKSRSWINYSSDKSTQVSLSIYDAHGNRIKNLVSEYEDVESPRKTQNIEQSEVESSQSVSVYQVKADEFTKSATMKLTK